MIMMIIMRIEREIAYPSDRNHTHLTFQPTEPNQQQSNRGTNRNRQVKIYLHYIMYISAQVYNATPAPLVFFLLFSSLVSLLLLLRIFFYLDLLDSSGKNLMLFLPTVKTVLVL